MLMHDIKNELLLQFVGIHGFNFALAHNSGSRAVMFGGHFSQRIILDDSMPSRQQTGIENEFGKYTFSVSMPENAKVIQLIQRYPAGVDMDSLPFNPETIVVYEEEDTHEIDFISITNYQSFHQTFGFRNVLNYENINRLRPGEPIRKGTIFADSPAVGKNSNYMFGQEFETAFISLPATAEDGFQVSKSALKKLKHRTYETRRMSLGSNKFPLNILGTTAQYKAFPDIGDYIREDGLLMITRPYDNDLTPVEMSIYDVQEPDFDFDDPLYTKAGRGRVIDITVVSNNNTTSNLPEAMTEQLRRYEKAKIRFHKTIVDCERRLRSEQRKKYGIAKLKLSEKFQQLVVDSLAITNHPLSEKNQNTLNLLYRKEPIDEFTIEFTIEYETIPGIGYKLSDHSGGKGVICKIVEDHEMPRDAAGNLAEIAADPVATLNRMNLARLFSHYHGGAARDITVHIRNMLGVNKQASLETIEQLDPKLVNTAYMHLLSYYDIISPRQYEFFRDLPAPRKLEHIYDVVTEGIYSYLPIDNPRDPVQIIKRLEQQFKPVYGPVSYVGNSGNRHTTEENIRVAPMTFMLLDKTATEWSATSSARLQHFGVLTPLTKSEKFSRPYRDSPTRTIGETEGRIYVCYAGRRVVAELMDRSNNPTVQKNIVYNILTADKPGNIDKMVDRKHLPYGESRSHENMLHICRCAGFTITYTPEVI